MNNDDRILFESYFRLVRESVNVNNKYFDFILNIILNSKEFEDSLIKISSKKQKSNLLSLVVNQKKGNNSFFEFYATYYVSDGIVLENRDIKGNIYINKGKIYLISYIHRFSNNEDYELGEFFEAKTSCYFRMSSYNKHNKVDKTCIPVDIFDKSSEFIDDTLQLIKKRG